MRSKNRANVRSCMLDAELQEQWLAPDAIATEHWKARQRSATYTAATATPAIIALAFGADDCAIPLPSRRIDLTEGFTNGIPDGSSVVTAAGVTPQ